MTPVQRAAFQSAQGVRNHANAWYAFESGKGALWDIHPERLPACADYVAEVIRTRYPTLEVPFHARWRHFEFGGNDLWADTREATAWRDKHALARAEFDLAITSVLLDAGAGAAWRYADSASSLIASRSEGLALASLRLFEWGGFSADPSDPLRADAEALGRFDATQLADAFQVTERNPLAGLDGRVRLLNRLGAHADAQGELFARADRPRPGGLYDVMIARAHDGQIAAPVILSTLLEALGPIWENRPVMNGVPLGDCWLVNSSFGYTPLHKLSQWLAYSLIEPLERAGTRVVDIDGLTGLAEYRNGGLFIDMDVLTPNSRYSLSETYPVSDPFIIVWRSLTVALLDRIAPLVRERLGVSATQFPLARVLEGGTWAAGREIARQKRVDGGPPLHIHSDGTVF
ncbi:MAG: DUF1688 family protein [Caulobacteraceae bacterium]